MRSSDKRNILYVASVKITLNMDPALSNDVGKGTGTDVRLSGKSMVFKRSHEPYAIIEGVDSKQHNLRSS
ncbi:hypothetical protein HZH68_004495 [Vespula germanica]|uniref:Uncharacterized protein n=1 Tax=Vespula germanica TaxID=30212 RepID=A0A834KRX4_VESGE|nr:hypothetical protein HZH68_004495 [Vespula germanica]